MNQSEFLANVSTGIIDSSETTAARAADCRARAGLFALLGRCFEAEVDSDLLELLHGPLAPTLGAMGLSARELLPGTSDTERLEALAEEFTGLFVAPGGVSPYASVFETGCMFQEVCDRVARAYGEAGFVFRPRLSGEFADHIALMFSFTAALYQGEAAALEAAESAEAEALRLRREDFFKTFVGAWGAGWCRRVQGAALLPFYASMAGLAEQFVWDELSLVCSRRELRELQQLNSREPKKLDYDADFRKASGL